MSSLTVTETGGAALPYDTQRLHSEVKLMWWEMEQLCAEGHIFVAPLSYTTR